MARRKRPARRPEADPPLTTTPEGESLEELIERAATIRRTSDGLIRRMMELEARIAEARARRREGSA